MKTGLITSGVMSRTNQNGTRIFSFRFNDGSEDFPCIAFNEAGECLVGATEGTTATIEGTFDSGITFKTYAAKLGTTLASHTVRKIREAGSIKEANKRRDEAILHNWQMDRIPIWDINESGNPILYFLHISICIMPPSVGASPKTHNWLRKVDFCLDVLGHFEYKNRLDAFGGSVNTKDKYKSQRYGLFLNKTCVECYAILQGYNVDEALHLWNSSSEKEEIIKQKKEGKEFFTFLKNLDTNLGNKQGISFRDLEPLILDI